MTNERENLRNIIVQWNANRLDLFALTEPNEELEFHGVMRYYFQDSGQKVATKCIRVASTATAKDVIQTLIEKFRPDIRMLSIPEYALYEIHENGEERKLLDEEKPLLVQLNWHKDDREGRFLLRRMDEKTFLPKYDPEANGFKRKLSKREKKEKKKKEKLERLKIREEECENKDGIAEKLYSELPETSFTRSISNPEAVMRRRRQQKLEKKLQQFRQEGGPEGGGTLRVFGESLNKDVPYKTILVSMRDPATYVVREVLEKYALDGEDACQYCLVQMIIPGVGDMDIHDYHSSSIREYILDDDDCPLAVERQHNRNKGILAFHIRKRPADYQPRKRKKKSKQVKGEVEGGRYDDSIERLPVLLELHPDGSDVPQSTAKKHRLFLNVTEVGSERSSSTSGQYLQLFGPNVQSRHCVIAHTEGIVTVTPSSRDAETYVNGVRIYETTILQHGGVVRFGKLHTFRFIDPLHDESRRLSPDQRQVDYTERLKEESQHHNSYETTFDADGNVETVSTHSRDDRMSRKSDDAHSHRSFGREGAQSRNELRRGNDPILPAVLEFWEDGEDAFLNSVIGQVDASQVQFKLAPTYVLYMTARYRASTHYRPDSSPSDRAHRLTALMIKISGMVHQVIQDRYRDGTSLAFWLANSSELLHFLKQDRHLCAYTLDTQDLLAESVQLAFRSLVTCQQAELHAVMPAILEDRDDLNEEEGTTGEVLVVLSAAMSLLRRCRVNAALTIQMFSQLFHYINMWLFNRVVCETAANYCTRLWGVRLKRRLARVELWAEKQGLELAADCHLSRIIQAARLLQSPKSSPEDIASISSACFKLNSLQLRTLFERYQPQPDEPLIPRDLIDTVVKVAANTADELAHSDGRDVRLEEDTDLQLPFLLPEDGYSCDIVRGVPAGLQEFLQPLLQTGLSRLTIQPTSSGYWTIYMSDQDVLRATQGARSPSLQSHQGDGEVSGRGSAALPNEPEVAIIKLQKSNNGMGLSIVAARGVGQDKLGIYIKSVVKGGAADQDGRLQAGDQLLKVDGQSLVGISQEKAAELMTRTGQVVTLEIAKQGAIYHGLAALLSQPSPVMQRAALAHQQHNPPRLLPKSQLRRYRTPSQSTSDLFKPPSAVSDSAPVPHRWEGVQTLDRPASGTSKQQKKGYNWYTNCPFSYLKTAQSDGSPKRHVERPKSDETLLDSTSLSSCTGCWPLGGLELSAGRPRSDESLPPHPSHCVCEKCCPLCRIKQIQEEFPKNPMYLQTNPAYGMTFCELYELQGIEVGCDPRLLKHTPQSSIDEGGPCACPACVDTRPGKIEFTPSRLPYSIPEQPSSQEQLFATATNQISPLYSTNSSLVDSGNQNGHRHTSERDIPSRVLQDQNHVLPSRIQGSKSVPSLNSNNNNSAPEPNGRNHEVYNPGYSRTSSNTSIPKAMDYPGPDGQAPRLKMGQEIHYDPRFQYPNRPGPPVNGTMVNVRQPPVPQHQPQVQVEERHYQNISMYQPQHYHPASRPSPQPYPQQAVQRQLHGSHSSLLRPDHQQPAPQSPMDRSRPMSTLVSPREQEQYVNAMNYNNNRSATSPVPPSSPHRVQPPVQMGFVPRDVMDSDPRLPMDGPPEHHPSGKMHPPSYGGQIDPRHRDILRQEAKMEEMREEVRRREERSQHPSVNNRGPIWQPGRPVPPSGTLTRQPYPPPQQPQSVQQYPIRAIGPPVTAPKPRPSGQRSQQGYEINDPQVYGDTPPPPPPPSSTHPLLQTSLPAPAVSYRYGPSGYPPRSSDGGLEPRAPHPNSARMEANRLHQRMAPNQSGNQPRMAPDMANTQDNKKEFSITSPSPWEREEKEKLRNGPTNPNRTTQNLLQKQRVEDARQARDDEIRDLENTTYRTPKQEERLRTLRLEQEFQRRAEEMRAEEDDDEDEDLLERAENRERTLRMQEDLERARQRRLEWEQEQQMKQQQDDWVRRRNNNNPPEAPERGVPQHVLQEQEGRLRQLRLEEGNRRKELEATKEAEDRLLKEARRRQEEEYRMHQQQLEQQRHMNSMHPPDLPPALPTSPPPIEPPHNHHQSYPPTGTQRLDNLVMHHGGYGSAPPPPERKSSYEVGNRPLPGSALRNGDIHQHPSNAPAPKKVSFHDSRLETEIGPTDRRNSASSNHSYTLEDIDSVLETPPPGHNNSTLINNNSISPTSTPGVIGAQEIYRDPRKRIEAERSYLQQSSRKPGPEQLSFREKMKMFALETGQDETPKDKVKISRAQRDIESRPNGPMAT